MLKLLFLGLQLIQNTIAHGGCYIKRGNQVLMVQVNSNLKWGVPGGHRDNNENSKLTAIRETYEETGYRVLPIRPLHTFRSSFVLYKCIIIGGHRGIIDRHEIHNNKWMTRNDLYNHKYSWRFQEELPYYRKWI